MLSEIVRKSVEKVLRESVNEYCEPGSKYAKRNAKKVGMVHARQALRGTRSYDRYDADMYDKIHSNPKLAKQYQNGFWNYETENWEQYHPRTRNSSDNDEYYDLIDRM